MITRCIYFFCYHQICNQFIQAIESRKNCTLNLPTKSDFDLQTCGINCCFFLRLLSNWTTEKWIIILGGSYSWKIVRNIRREEKTIASPSTICMSCESSLKPPPSSSSLPPILIFCSHGTLLFHSLGKSLQLFSLTHMKHCHNIYHI